MEKEAGTASDVPAFLYTPKHKNYRLHADSYAATLVAIDEKEC